MSFSIQTLPPLPPTGNSGAELLPAGPPQHPHGEPDAVVGIVHQECLQEVLLVPTQPPIEDPRGGVVVRREDVVQVDPDSWSEPGKDLE